MTADTATMAKVKKQLPLPEGVENDRRSNDRRTTEATDRRAFWRPTPDRRREETEQGRRVVDAPDRR
ncbi:MAG: hypothetical protein ACXWUG_13765 [Polyangiales bacterium]